MLQKLKISRGQCRLDNILIFCSQNMFLRFQQTKAMQLSKRKIHQGAILNVLLNKEHVLISRQSFFEKYFELFFTLAFVEKVNRFLL